MIQNLKIVNEVFIDDNDYLKIVEKITKKERTTQNKENKKADITYENTEETEKNRYNNSDGSETLKTKVKWPMALQKIKKLSKK